MSQRESLVSRWRQRDLDEADIETDEGKEGDSGNARTGRAPVGGRRDPTLIDCTLELHGGCRTDCGPFEEQEVSSSLALRLTRF